MIIKFEMSMMGDLKYFLGYNVNKREVLTIISKKKKLKENFKEI